MIRIFHHYVSKTAFMLLLVELTILLAAAVATAPLWERGKGAYLTALIFALVQIFSMSTLGMYQHTSRDDIKNTLLRIIPAFVLGFCILNLLFGAAPAGVFVLSAGGVLLARLIVFTSVQSNIMERRLILVGEGAMARECMELASVGTGFHQFKVVGCIPVEGEACCVPPAALLAADQSLLAQARAHNVDEIVVTVGNRRNGAFPVRQLLECALNGFRVTDVASFFEREACQIHIDSLQPSFLIFGGGFDQSMLRAAVKRAFDLTASAAIAVLTLPLMVLTALLVWLEDRGPVFYQQERIGRHGRHFRILKFRSMRPDAELNGTPQWATDNDPRVTRVGHWIRKLRIDELPQMLNVFKGEMSFVGPRPERGFFVTQLCAEVAYYNVRHSIKPGITGLAQVRYRYGASVEDAVRKLQYDLYYVKNNSLFLDLLILLDTVQVVLFGKGGR